MTTTTTTRTTKPRKAATNRAPGKAAPSAPVGPVEVLDFICRQTDNAERIAMERIAASAAELVATLQGAGVTFRDPDRAPSQVGASILAAWSMARGARDTDADLAIIADGVTDGLRHALTSSAPCAPLARSILGPAPSKSRGGAR